MAGLSDDAEKKWMDHVAGLTTYTVPPGSFAALWIGDPTDTGLGGAEASGGGYARQSITWSAPSSQQISNTAQLVFDNMQVGTYDHIAIFSAVTGGDFLASQNLNDPLTASASQNIEIDPGQLVVAPSFNRFTNATLDNMLNHIFRQTAYTQPTLLMSLHSSDPGQTGTGEFTGGTYARQTPSWNAAVPGSGGSAGHHINTNNGLIEFDGLDASDANLRFWGLWDGLTFFGRYDQIDRAISTGDKIQFPDQLVAMGVN